MGIEWRDPPEPRGQNHVWMPLLAPLVEQPGRWAMVRAFPSPSGAQNANANLRARRLLMPDGKWEFVARGCEVFARYLGPKEDS